MQTAGIADAAHAELAQSSLTRRAAEAGDDVDRSRYAIDQRGDGAFVGRPDGKDTVGAGVHVQAAASNGLLDRRLAWHRLTQEHVDARIQHDVDASRPGD